MKIQHVLCWLNVLVLCWAGATRWPDTLNHRRRYRIRWFGKWVRIRGLIYGKPLSHNISESPPNVQDLSISQSHVEISNAVSICFLGGGWGYRGVLTRGHGRNTSNKANTQDRTHRNTSCNVLKSGTYAFIWTTSIFIQDNTKKPNAAEADRHRLNISLKSYNISSTWSQQ